MPKKEHLTPFEWEVMKILWELKGGTVRDVADRLPESYRRAYTTVQTYVERLAQKGYLTKRKEGRQNLFTPTEKSSGVIRRETEHFVDRAFSGSFSRLAAFLARTGKLTEADIRELRELATTGGEDKI